MASEDPFPLDVVEGLVPALLRVYSLVHGLSYETGKPLDRIPSPQELVDAVCYRTSLTDHATHSVPSDRRVQAQITDSKRVTIQIAGRRFECTESR
jgi:hypothetical protein